MFCCFEEKFEKISKRVCHSSGNFFFFSVIFRCHSGVPETPGNLKRSQMKLPSHFLTIHAACTISISAALAACGGGDVIAPEQNPIQLASISGSSLLSTSAYIPQSRGTAVSNGTSNIINGMITNVRFESTSEVAQTNVPVTFGQVFVPGDLAASSSLVGHLDGSTIVPLQLDIKARHADGSVRHAVISAILPSLAAGEIRSLTLNRSSTAATPPRTVSSLLAAGFTATFNATIAGVRYTASADQLLKYGESTTWLAGSTANEWHVSAPLVTGSGIEHPHLSARFAIRWYEGANKARVDVAVENNWAYEAAPRNFTYDAELVIGGKSVYTKAGLNHLHHARWRKVAWWGGSSAEVNIKHNSAYLIATRAIPNYDQSISVPEAALKDLKTRWVGQSIEPMGVGLANPYMPSTGGRPEIGIMPSWAVTYLLSMDKRAKEVTLGTADLAGSWSMHYRDRVTDRPISIMNYPYMTIVGRPNDAINPVTKKSESFPACATTTACTTTNVHDSAHQPGFAYLPYLVTGDYYYLEELQFWAMMNSFSSNPYYRQFNKGLYQSDQVRGQAWSLRTIAEVAYITPDSDPLKSDFMHFATSNLNWYNTSYTHSSTANNLGALTHGAAIVYSSATGLAPWMDDFFTAAVGHAAELGFAEANELLKWKSKFPIARMTDPGTCWIDAAIYTLKVRDSAKDTIYSSMAEAYTASHNAQFNALACNSAAMAAALKLKVGEMTGYSGVTTGYPSNMQPALAYSADANPSAGKKAWNLFMSRTVKPTYGMGPQFAIVPR